MYSMLMYGTFQTFDLLQSKKFIKQKDLLQLLAHEVYTQNIYTFVFIYEPVYSSCLLSLNLQDNC